ncbi:sister chromatid cohesion protein DCC1 [Phlebotomus argentipes]|uniref:sister chromatid cohesion protein DCC1 n=1 Tax=Phlebotomus argentipes TaxID=94469 RepID=UPI002892F4CD|nr:sister chromatid cohesion protein DCC1 [Phlebotomus argentipes]
MDSQPEIYRRNLQDVHETIAHAKLEEKNLTDLTQALYFPDITDDMANVKLLELNPHLLQHIQEGQTLYLKGGLTENVVLCTDSKTFDLKEAEVSNSLCLIPDLKFAQETSHNPLKAKSANTSADSSMEEEEAGDHLNRSDLGLEHREVFKIFQEYFEVREIQPRFRKLHDLLQMTRYSGPENEYCIERKVLFTRQQLLDTIQCSEEEFEKGLQLMRVIEIDEFMRILETEYEFRVMGLLLGVIDENSWRLDEVECEESVNCLKEIVPENILRAVFALYTQPSVDHPGKFSYNEEEVCRIMARNILKPGLKFHIEDFLSTWQGTLPEGMQIQEKFLRGIGVIDRESKMPCVRTLLETSLPTNPHERFHVLFQTKDCWTLEEIEPYVECFATPTTTVTTILNKFTRSMNKNGQRVYLSKH